MNCPTRLTITGGPPPAPLYLETVIAYLLDADHDISQALAWVKGLPPQFLTAVNSAAAPPTEWYVEKIGELIAGLKLTAAALGLDPEAVEGHVAKMIALNK